MHTLSPTLLRRPRRSPLPAVLAAAGLLLGALPLARAQASAADSEVVGPGYFSLNGGPSDFSRISAGNGLYPRGDRDTVYSLALGNYLFTPHLGVELGYTNFGQISRGGGSTKAEGVNLSLIGKLPLSQRFNLLGKLGTTYGHTDTTALPVSNLASGSEYGFDWSYGVGAELVINPSGPPCCSMTSTT